MTLTLADANRVIAGAIAKATAIGAKMNIAVCDAGGRLLAFQRMDGAMWAGSYGSQGKAVASAAFGRPSGDLTPRADHPTLRGIAMAEGNHMFLGQGAVPIFRSGVLGNRAVNAKALVFSVKGEDLLFLDQANTRLAGDRGDDLRAAYARLGLPAAPFGSAGFFAPPFPDDLTGRPHVTGRTSGVAALLPRVVFTDPGV